MDLSGSVEADELDDHRLADCENHYRYSTQCVNPEEPGDDLVVCPAVHRDQCIIVDCPARHPPVTESLQELPHNKTEHHVDHTGDSHLAHVESIHVGLDGAFRALFVLYQLSFFLCRCAWRLFGRSSSTSGVGLSGLLFDIGSLIVVVSVRGGVKLHQRSEIPLLAHERFIGPLLINSIVLEANDVVGELQKRKRVAW